jgi:sulfur-oxidizing protein SoxY
MRIRPLPVREPAAMSRVQLMIRHPNNSGLQMDQLTRLYIPAMFVDHITVKQGNDLVFEMEGGISISEDPTFRFNYPDNGGSLAVEAHDTDGRRFTGMLPAAADGRS